MMRDPYYHDKLRELLRQLEHHIQMGVTSGALSTSQHYRMAIPGGFAPERDRLDKAVLLTVSIGEEPADYANTSDMFST